MASQFATGAEYKVFIAGDQLKDSLDSDKVDGLNSSYQDSKDTLDHMEKYKVNSFDLGFRWVYAISFYGLGEIQ